MGQMMMSMIERSHSRLTIPLVFMLGLMLVSLLRMPVAEAATIHGIHLLSDGKSQSLRVSMDAAGAYQVFNLEGPSRLVLNFPGTKLAEDIAQVSGDGGVDYVRTSSDAQGSRIEVGLAKGVQYDIAEKGNDLLISFASDAAAVAAGGALIEDIQVRDSGSVTELVLRGKHMDANHNALMTNGGKTLVLDFWGGASHLPKEHYTYTAQRVNDVTVGAADKRLRLVVSLRGVSGSNQQIEASANQMVVRLGDVKVARAASGAVVEAVDFQPDDRVGHLVIRTDTTDPVVNLQEMDGKIILDIKRAHLASGQERSQDVRAFPGPISQVDSYGKGRDVRIVARLREKSQVSSYQSGNVLTLTVRPESLAVAKQGDDATAGDKVYSGQKVTFNYKDIDIRNALQLIAEMSNLNIILSDDVSGVLTMRLVDVPWDQALDLILQARGLGKEQNGNVLRVAPLAVLKKDADERKQAKQSAEEVAPLETEFITLGYASVSDMKTILQGGSVSQSATAAATDTAASAASSSELKLLSARGSILLDERSNTMIITDTRDRLNNIKRLVSVIDKPTQQVLVEARIVEASDTFARDLGVRWGGSARTAGGTQTVYGAGNPAGVTGLNNAGAAANNVVDLAAATGAGAGGAIGYTLGTLGGALNLNLELSAAEQEGDVKVVSSPRVFTSNLQEALIEQDEQIPFNQVTTSGGATTVTPVFKSAKLTLKVTPQVTADKRIIMQLVVNKDTPVTNAAGTATAVNTKTVSTKLLVKNGETVVLGGIYSQTLADTVNGVPGLMNLPIIGHLFKRKQKTDNRSELLIFITPTIIGGDGQEQVSFQ